MFSKPFFFFFCVRFFVAIGRITFGKKSLLECNNSCFHINIRSSGVCRTELCMCDIKKEIYGMSLRKENIINGLKFMGSFLVFVLFKDKYWNISSSFLLLENNWNHHTNDDDFFNLLQWNKVPKNIHCSSFLSSTLNTGNTK